LERDRLDKTMMKISNKYTNTQDITEIVTQATRDDTKAPVDGSEASTPYALASTKPEISIEIKILYS
jgi:hypothetical protein